MTRPGEEIHDGALSQFTGIAPGARIVNVRAGAADGAVDVSQIIAALDWVIANRTNPYVAPNLNIRVINLSFGTDGARRTGLGSARGRGRNAWRHGIVVVVSAGNDGYSLGRLTDPAIDPYVLAVGAGDSMGTFTTIDDRIADYSSPATACGGPNRRARHLACSLAVHGSAIDNTYPRRSRRRRFLRGERNSQAAAVVTGAIPVLLSRHPGLPPDAIKAVIRASGHGIAGTVRNGNPLDQNMKRLDISAAGAAIDNWKRGSLRDQHTYCPHRRRGTARSKPPEGQPRPLPRRRRHTTRTHRRVRRDRRPVELVGVAQERDRRKTLVQSR